MVAWRRETFESPPSTRFTPASRPIVNSGPVTSMVWPACGPAVIRSCKTRATLTRVSHFRHSHDPALRAQLGRVRRRGDFHEGPDRHRREELDLACVRAGELQRVLECREQDAAVNRPIGALVILL